MVNDLPLNGAEVDVTLSTNHEGFWSREAYRLYGAGIIPDAELTSHSHLEQLDSSQALFTWTEISQADHYRILVRAVDGAGEPRRVLHNEDYDTHITALAIDGLPQNGAYFDVIIRTLQNEWWAETFTRLRGVQLLSNATLVSHQNNDVLTSLSVSFRWSDVGAKRYQLIIRDDGGTRYREILNNQVTSVTIDNLPRDGSSIELELYTDHDGWWSKEKYRFSSQ